MQAFDIPGLDQRALVNFRIHDVSAADVTRAREAYGDDLTAGDLLDIAIHRWEPRR
jgi:hypothetical protein